MAYDLHVHTTGSDGIFPPCRVIEMGQSLGLEGIAITDHDTVCGIEEAVMQGKKSGLVVVPGIELSCEHRNAQTGKMHQVHVLGYFLEKQDRAFDKDFLAKLDYLQKMRRLRGTQILDALDAHQMVLNRDFLQGYEQAGSIGRMVIARELVKAGYVHDTDKAFKKWLNPNRPAYIERVRVTPIEAIGWIEKAGGISVLAHPGLAGADELIPSLAEGGLAGLEVFHPAHSNSVSAFYARLASSVGLIPTGGSDFHDSGLGNYTTSEQSFAGLCRFSTKKNQ